MKIKSPEQMAQVLEDFGGETLAVRTHVGDLFLVYSTEDDDAYQGVPFAEDEDGRKVNRNSGYVRDLPDVHWPVALVTPYGESQKRWRESRLRFRAPRSGTEGSGQ